MSSSSLSAIVTNVFDVETVGKRVDLQKAAQDLAEPTAVNVAQPFTLTTYQMRVRNTAFVVFINTALDGQLSYQLRFT